jgi:thioredoxin-related protein
MKKPICTILIAAAASLAPLHAEFRTWTNTAGVAIQGEFVKAEGDDVTLRLRNGKLSTFPQSKLSPADQERVKASKEEPTPATDEAKPAVDPKRKAKWLTKMDKAQEEAKETGLPILALFTGTSWCPYCVKLEKQVFSESAFKAFANQNLVLLILDYGPGGTAKNKKDKELSKEYAVTGFPTYFLTDADGEKLAQGGYQDGINPEKFAEWVNQAVPKK